MERSAIFHGKIHYKWQFSIAMLNYQRVEDFSIAMFEYWRVLSFSQILKTLCLAEVRVLQGPVGEVRRRAEQVPPPKRFLYYYSDLQPGGASFASSFSIPDQPMFLRGLKPTRRYSNPQKDRLEITLEKSVRIIIPLIGPKKSPFIIPKKKLSQIP